MKTRMRYSCFYRHDYAPGSVAERCFEILKHSNLNLDLQFNTSIDGGPGEKEAVNIQVIEDDEDEDEI
jgi:hypothetical protein